MHALTGCDSTNAITSNKSAITVTKLTDQVVTNDESTLVKCIPTMQYWLFWWVATQDLSW